jgi:hypothetical protein
MFFEQSALLLNQQLNGSTQQSYSKIPLLYRARGCNINLSANNPASQYQRQKQIQNTLGVYASLYAANLAPLNAYEKPRYAPQVIDVAGSLCVTGGRVNWNQMSDRRQPHIQVVKSGSAYGASSTKRTITSQRPGALSPGGTGVDIKHNSYERYLNRIKGKGPFRRGPIPPTFGSPYIPFNPAYPVYGGKVMKMSIVSNCNCEIDETRKMDKLLYQNSSEQDSIYNVKFEFKVGDFVWAKKTNNDTFYKAEIIAISGNLYLLKFEDGTEIYTNQDLFTIYFDCGKCSIAKSDIDQFLDSGDNKLLVTGVCQALSLLSYGELI